MIRIIKNGNINKINQTREFKCNVCDCVFTADKEDYEVFYSQIHGDWVRINCPFCHHEINENIN